MVSTPAAVAALPSRLPVDTPARRDPRTLTLAMRREFARLVFAAYMRSGERPSPVVCDYLRPFLEMEREEEQSGLDRLDRLVPVGGFSGPIREPAHHSLTPLRDRMFGRPEDDLRPPLPVVALIGTPSR